MVYTFGERDFCDISGCEGKFREYIFDPTCWNSWEMLIVCGDNPFEELPRINRLSFQKLIGSHSQPAEVTVHLMVLFSAIHIKLPTFRWKKNQNASIL